MHPIENWINAVRALEEHCYRPYAVPVILLSTDDPKTCNEIIVTMFPQIANRTSNDL